MNEGSSNREMEKLHPELNDMNNKAITCASVLRRTVLLESAPLLR